jgi:hypothetical protein
MKGGEGRSPTGEKPHGAVAGHPTTPLSDTSEKTSSAFLSKEQNFYNIQGETDAKDKGSGPRLVL